MRVLGRIISFFLAVLLGFWLASADILTGTQAGEVMDTIVAYLPDREQVYKLFDGSSADEIPEVNVDNNVNNFTVGEEVVTSHNEVDYAIVEAAIVELTNELRQEKGLSTLTQNDMLRAAAYVRAEELEEQFSHTRPDGTDAFTVFQEEGIFYPYQIVGENLAMGTKYLLEQEMAEFLFQGWIESEGHYANMIREEYEEIGGGVHYEGEMLYGTQVFSGKR